MTLTKKQRALIERHARGYDINAKVLKTLRPRNFKPSKLRLYNSVVSCSFDKSLTRRISGIASTPSIYGNHSLLSRVKQSPICGRILRSPS
jgi:hypothetical protein